MFELNLNTNTTNAATGGDGLDPIPYRATDGSLRIWNIYHHFDQLSPASSKPAIICTNPKTAQRCDLDNDGSPDTTNRYIRPDGGDITQPYAGTDSIITSNWNYSSGSVTYGSNNREVYVSVQNVTGPNNVNTDPLTADPSRIGVYCFNMETGNACGYWDLGQTTTYWAYDAAYGVNVIHPTVAGALQYQNKMFIINENVKSSILGNPEILCFDLATKASCGSYNLTNSNGTPSLSNPRLVLSNDKIYTSTIKSSPGAGQTYIECVTINMVHCSGFTDGYISGITDNADGSFLLPIVDSSTGIGKICLQKGPSVAILAFSCFNNITGVHEATPPVLDSILTSIASLPAVADTIMSYRPEYYLQGNRLYIAINYWLDPSPGSRSAVACYDTGTNAMCPDFATTSAVPGVLFSNEILGPSNASDGGNAEYGYSPDDQGCMWALGDAGVLYSFDSQSGSIPCIRSSSSVVIDPNSQLCEPNRGRLVSAVISDIDQSKILSESIEIRDKNGNTIPLSILPVKNLNSTTWDLSSITTAANNSRLMVIVNIEPTDTTMWQNGNSPKLTVTYAPDTTNGVPFGQPGYGEPLTDLIINGCRVGPKIDKTNNFNPQIMGINSTFDYTLTITNDGPSDAATMTVTDILPSRISIVNPLSLTINGLSPSGGESCTISSTGVLSCTLKNLLSTKVYTNSKRVIRYKAIINRVNPSTSPIEDGLAVTNSASVYPVCQDQPTIDGANTNCNPNPPQPATSTVDPEVIDLDVKKYITTEFDGSGNPINWKSSDVKAVPGKPVAYKITVTNNEYATNHVTGQMIKDLNNQDIPTNSARNFIVKDTIPAGLTNISTTHNAVSGVVVSPVTSAVSPVDINFNITQLDPAKSIDFITKGDYLGEEPNVEFSNLVQHYSNSCSNSDGSQNTNCNKDVDSISGNCQPLSPRSEDDCGVRKLTQDRVYDIETLKTIDKQQPINKVGEELEYTIKITNLGPANSKDSLSMEDTIPQELDYISNQPDAKIENCTYDSSMRKLSCSLKSIEPGDANSAILKIKVKLNSKAVGLNFDNTFKVQCIAVNPNDLTSQGETDCDNNNSIISVDPSLADLTINKKIRLANGQLVDSGNLPSVGSSITFVIELTNLGPDTANNIKVKDSLPEGLEYLSSQPDIGDYDYQSGIWSISQLAKDAKVGLIITATYKNGSSIKNLAEIIESSTPDPNSTPNNCDSGKKKEDDCADVTVKLSAGGKGIGIPITGALVGKIIAGATGISLAAYLGRDLMLRYQKRSNSER